MTDINTLMALMSALGGMKRENGGDAAPRGNAMMNILPLVMRLTGGRQAERGYANGAALPPHVPSCCRPLSYDTSVTIIIFRRIFDCVCCI